MQEADHHFKAYLHLQDALKTYQSKHRNKKIAELTQMYEHLITHQESPDLIAKRLNFVRIKQTFKLPKESKEELIKIMFAYAFNPKAEIYLTSNFLFL